MRNLFAIFVLWLVGSAIAQPESDFTINIDTSQSVNQHKSLGVALTLSGLMPGMGQWYLQEKTSAKAYALTDVGVWVGLGISMLAMNAYLDAAQHYGRAYAGLPAGERSVHFLNTMAQYRSYREISNRRDSYEHAQVLAGLSPEEYSIAANPENYWDFGSAANPQNTEHWNAFNESLKSYGYAKVMRSWMVGGLVMGRIVSFFHTLQFYRKTAVRGLGAAPAENQWHYAWVGGPRDFGSWEWQLQFHF